MHIAILKELGHRVPAFLVKGGLLLIKIIVITLFVVALSLSYMRLSVRMSERQKAKEAEKRKLEEEAQQEKEARAQEDSRSLREIVRLLERIQAQQEKASGRSEEDRNFTP